MKKNVCISIVAILLFACGTKTDKADVFYQQAMSFYQQKSFDEAKKCLDSIHTHFPTMVDKRRQADTLLWRINAEQIAKELPKIDSAIEQSLQQAEAMAKNYKFHKNEKYQSFGDYEHTLMQSTNNTNRTYLKPITNENGKFIIISNLVGKNINHRQIIATSKGDSFSSPKAKESDCYSYNDLGIRHEMVSFSDSTIIGLVEFLRSNIDNQVHISLEGDKKYSYKLSPRDIRIIVDSYDFSKVLSEIYTLQIKKVKMAQRYDYLTLKLAKATNSTP